MKHLLLAFLLVSLSAKAQLNVEDSLFIRRIFDEALTNSKCYDVLRHLCKEIGPRLSGSKGAADAVDYLYTSFQKEGFDSLFLQEMMVPHWVRGKVCRVTSNEGKNSFSACALGNSIGGKANAQVLMVEHIEDLDSLDPAQIKDKIVFFTRPMEPRHINTFKSYGACVDQRWAGPSKAAKYGAVATLVRSMSHKEDEFPHTGSMSYDSLYPKIPALALSTASATRLKNMLEKNPKTVIQLETDCYNLPDTVSHNVIAQLGGREFNTAFLISGGHLDAWDNGEGAHDDGAGCVQSYEALRILKNLGYKPRHNLRAVMFMNEENGLRGGKKYAELALKNKESHLAAIESDRGGFTPRGFEIESNDPAKLEHFKQWKALLAPYGLTEIGQGHGGADIGPLKTSGTLCIGYLPDSQRYFDHHHAGSDTFEEVNKRELELGAASIAALLYLMDKYGVLAGISD